MSNPRTRVIAASLILALAGLALWPTGGAEARDKRDLLGSYRDWDAFLIRKDSGERQCYMASLAKSKSPGNVTHGDVYITVTHRPRLKVVDEVNLVTGYSFRPNTEVTASISKRNFRMFTEGDGAWLRTPREDKQMVGAMKSGESLFMRGTSSRGTGTSYRFSLAGFTAAHNAIGKACK
jgi:hypothetical protein